MIIMIAKNAWPALMSLCTAHVVQGTRQLKWKHNMHYIHDATETSCAAAFRTCEWKTSLIAYILNTKTLSCENCLNDFHSALSHCNAAHFLKQVRWVIKERYTYFCTFNKLHLWLEVVTDRLNVCSSQKVSCLAIVPCWRCDGLYWTHPVM